MWNFDIIKIFFKKIDPAGLHNLRKKSSFYFYGRWAWHPQGNAMPSSLGIQIAEYQGFYMRYCWSLY